MRNKLAILLMMLAALGHTEESSLRPDDVAVIKEALLHFSSQTNYFKGAPTNAPFLLIELWSSSKILDPLVSSERCIYLCNAHLAYFSI